MSPVPRPRHSLSRRLLMITIGAVLCLEFLFFMPALTRARSEWLRQRVIEAELAALSGASVSDGTAGYQTRDQLLHLSGTEVIQLQTSGVTRPVLGDPASTPPDGRIDLAAETVPIAVLRTLQSLASRSDSLSEIRAPSAIRPDSLILVTVHEARLARYLRDYAAPASLYALLEAVLSGCLVYVVCRRVFVKPMQRMIDSIHRFRADPERAPPLMLKNASILRSDELALAAHELGAMQRELRTALWRNARLAAIGTAVAKVSHDLRGVLSPAMLVAERLQGSQDPSTSKAGAILVRAVERAVELVRGPLEFAREAPVTPNRTAFNLREVVAEVETQTLDLAHPVVLELSCDPDLSINGDADLMERVLANLVRNSSEAGGSSVRISAELQHNQVAITVADDASGLPDNVQENLFKPFVSSSRTGSTGLGLAIVRDLIQAQGGEITLVQTGPDGTTFRILVPAALPVPPKPPLSRRSGRTPISPGLARRPVVSSGPGRRGRSAPPLRPGRRPGGSPYRSGGRSPASRPERWSRRRPGFGAPCGRGRLRRRRPAG